MEYIFETKNLSYQYPCGTLALRELNIGIKKGKKTALLGCNGAGKSTLIGHLNGLLKPSTGHLNYKGNPVSYKKKVLMSMRKEVGIIIQDPDIHIFSPYVMDELIFGPLNFGLSLEKAKQKAHQVVEALGLSPLLERPTHQLSYGQKKLVSIASIMTSEPEILVLDEPLSGLDPYHQQLVLQILDRLFYNGITQLICTHDVDFAYEWADEVIVFHHGTCIASGSPVDVFQQPDVISKGHLRIPRLLELFNSLCLNCVPPTSVTDFKELLQKGFNL